MASKGLSLGEIAHEINDVLVRFLPMGMMLATSLFEIRANGFEVSWWGGGLPDGYLIDRDGSIVRRLVSTHMPLGVLKKSEFEADLVHFKLEPEQQIICYTDGVIEATNPEGEQFGQHRLEKAIEGGRVVLPSLYNSIRDFAHKSVGDDLSILAMTFPISNGNSQDSVDDESYQSQVPITSTLRFTGQVLRKVNVMTEVRQFMTGILQGGSHLDLICSVLSELFANAIEHGLLRLDSSIKEESDGFFLFYQQREEQLKQLDDNAWIELVVNYQPDKNLLVLDLEHNGEGFEYQAPTGQSDGMKTHGRGIVLASELCDSLEYSKQGCKVKAVYSIGASHHFPSSA
jgi:anti-sigma regulatory factor (Ser/Thr protein kinase)